MPIEPDTKDWTWVLHERCPECGFDPLEVDRDDLGRRIRHAAAAMHERMHGERVTERPDDATWSPLEYAAHVRDVCGVMQTRLHQMLAQVDLGGGEPGECGGCGAVRRVGALGQAVQRLGVHGADAARVRAARPRAPRVGRDEAAVGTGAARARHRGVSTAIANGRSVFRS